MKNLIIKITIILICGFPNSLCAQLPVDEYQFLRNFSSLELDTIQFGNFKLIPAEKKAIKMSWDCVTPIIEEPINFKVKKALVHLDGRKFRIVKFNQYAFLIEKDQTENFIHTIREIIETVAHAKDEEGKNDAMEVLIEEYLNKIYLTAKI